MIPVPSLPQALDAGLRSQVDSWDEGRLHISDLAVGVPMPDGKCPRELWLRLRGAKKKDVSAGTLLMWDHGKRIHERLVEIIRQNLNSGWQIEAVERQVELYGITGRYDTRLYNADEGWEIIVDFKSIRGRAFNWLVEAKPSNVIQVQGYVTAADGDAGLVFYIDREGQNQAKQFYAQRDDSKVWQAVKAAKAVARGNEPGILGPKIVIAKNKGPDSVKLEMPWQCSYCDFCGPSCPGALPPKMRELGIVGHVDGGVFAPKVQDKEVVTVVETLLEMQGYAPLPF